MMMMTMMIRQFRITKWMIHSTDQFRDWEYCPSTLPKFQNSYLYTIYRQNNDDIPAIMVEILVVVCRLYQQRRPSKKNKNKNVLPSKEFKLAGTASPSTPLNDMEVGYCTTRVVDGPRKLIILDGVVIHNVVTEFI